MKEDHIYGKGEKNVFLVEIKASVITVCYNTVQTEFYNGKRHSEFDVSVNKMSM